MRNIILLSLILIFLCFSVCVFADVPAEIKTDSIKAEESVPTYSDIRLNQKVTYKAENKPVRDVLSDLTTMTGVSFFSGTNSKDWLVRDRKLIIFVKDVPLGSLKDSIARVLKMKWREFEDEGKISYRLFQDQKTLTDEEKRQKEVIEAARREHYKRSKQALDDMINTANMSPDQLENLREKNPYLYLLGTTGIANFAKTLVNEVPEAGTALLGGDLVEISNSRITPNVRRSIEQALDGSARVFSKVMKADSKSIKGLKNNLSDISITINNKFYYSSDSKRLAPGYILLNMGKKTKYIPYFTKPNTFNSFASAVLKSQEQSAKFDDVLSSMGGYSLIKAFKDNLIDMDTAEKPVEHPDDSTLLKEIQIKDKYFKLREYLSALSDEANINIVSDSLGIIFTTTNSNKIPTQKTSILDYLEAVGSRFNANWDKNDNIIEYRHKEWFKKRALLIPDEILNAWKNKLIATGTLDIEDLSQMAQLDYDRRVVNIHSDELLNNSKVQESIGINYNLLTLYAQMTNQQKQALFSNPGIVIKSTDENIEFPDLLRGYISDDDINSSNTIYLSCKTQPLEGQYKYTFILTTGNGSNKNIINRDMLTPIYQPLVEKPKPDLNSVK